jgi:hypothetical protein
VRRTDLADLRSAYEKETAAMQARVVSADVVQVGDAPGALRTPCAGARVCSEV